MAELCRTAELVTCPALGRWGAEVNRACRGRLHGGCGDRGQPAAGGPEDSGRTSDSDCAQIVGMDEVS